MKPKFTELLLASFRFEDYDPLQTRVLLLNALLFIAVVVNAVFMFVNSVIVHKYQLLMINTTMFLFSLYALYILREKNSYRLASYIGNTVLFGAFISLMLTQHGENFTLIWTYFFTPFAILTLGASRGLLIASVFLMIALVIAFTGIDVWQEGIWNAQSYLRFFVAHFLMLYVIYAFQNSNERANEKIEAMRLKEKEQLKLFEKLSITDALTSLYNRRFLDEIFPRQINTAKRHGQLLAFFILDLDYFKQYNDTYGHQQGDKVLEEIAKILTQHLRRSEDYAFRMGGEEFAGIVMGDELACINSTLNAIHQAVIDLQIEHTSSKVKNVLTCSIGVYVVENDTESAFAEIYRFTDKALYDAKDRGRNKIVFY